MGVCCASVVRAIASLVVLAASACSLGAPEITSLKDGGAGGGSPEPGPPAPDSGVVPHAFPDSSLEPPPPQTGESILVYAHSGSDLFSVDPEELVFTRVGPFTELAANGQSKYIGDVTDIAIDRDGRVVGTTYHRLLEIDPKTAICKPIASLPGQHSFNGLSWVRAQNAELLLATTQDGSVYRIDPTNGQAFPVGTLGAGLGSSGDLVSVEGYGTLITTTGPESDRLARIDPATGVAEIIGATGFKRIWGLGFWKNKVFGFTSTGQFILIDPRTGAGTLVETIPAFPFWGAGVTTAVPVIF